MNMEPHAIFSEDENGRRVAQIAWVTPATPGAVSRTLFATKDSDDGRSGWHWVRLQDGTLMLAVFPQGDTYIEMSDSGVCDWEHRDVDQ